ncbi:hypothetical protein CAS74_000848 [Pichia kudriavzevii]|nr:hypothetical protein JL09_g3382 [Pichia kudriavzevii]OUT24460.1 hypothetical protein CAS74_000848 [Pichia kudriavzevii]
MATQYYCSFDKATPILRVPTTPSLYHIRQQETPEKPSSLKFVKSHMGNRNGPLSPFSDTFYRCNDMWEFDNVGVSKPTEDSEFIRLSQGEQGAVNQYQIVRYLVCGDCERGALGFAGIPTADGAIKDLQRIHPNDLVYFFYL